MKYNLILTVMLISTVFSNQICAQTKEETEFWIIKQTQGNPEKLKYATEGDALISRVDLTGGIGGFGSKVEKAIPIGKLTYTTYTHTPKYLLYSLMCNESCAYLLDEPDSKRPKFLFEIYQNLDPSFPSRMNKALLNLVKSHGGSAKVVKQEVSKEPF
jgi:hypothetical protein